MCVCVTMLRMGCIETTSQPSFRFGKQTLSWIFQSGLDTRCSDSRRPLGTCGVGRARCAL